ncbi:MAG TPA: uroporphyrinogen decarboxylase [Clostridiales bacterium]|nr:uroporphyrinogen decarboxylase [Clostridiales bacterium]
MNGKQLVIDTLKHKKTSRIPWIPFAGVHAGLLCGYDAKEVLTDADKLYQSVNEANKIYHADGQPVVFDLQIEAEILGCKLQWETYSPPSVKTHPLENTDEIPCLCTLPKKESGRIPIVLDVMTRLKNQIGEDTALFGLVCGPFTLASHLRGTNIFMDMYDDEDYVKRLLDYCTKVAMVMSEYYIEAGMDVVAAVDPLVSQISPDHFETFLLEPYTKLFDHIKQMDTHTAFFVCGNASANIDIMCQSSPDAIFVDENVDLKKAQQTTRKYNITIGGNIPLTSIMLHGTQQDNIKYTIDLIDSLEKDNLIIAPGCDMPYHTPIENTVAVSQAVQNTQAMRASVQNYDITDDGPDVTLPDYTKLERPLVEVFTLDSATCAACTYMMASALDAKKEYGDKIDIVEYKFTVKENISRVKKMGVQKLPSIYINGQLQFSSIIPRKSELFDRINEVL